jgi:hypothetical protein
LGTSLAGGQGVHGRALRGGWMREGWSAGRPAPASAWLGRSARAWIACQTPVLVLRPNLPALQRCRQRQGPTAHVRCVGCIAQAKQITCCGVHHSVLRSRCSLGRRVPQLGKWQVVGVGETLSKLYVSAEVECVLGQAAVAVQLPSWRLHGLQGQWAERLRGSCG